ncbi:hypothetical protein GO009_08305 [Muricauda sp. TY007]|uniref:hypothetical protein n=1 Tax=Allomuricauda sp. TY007 TaxID=2683200 RepID=UPI0013BEFD19|nr:hypothetical protein [Muricauda sp. TY007]NDV16024.1 hypothetical protein [Muricauda sp. TY007]
MKEEQIKKVLKESEIRTSDGFTDRLMQRIEQEEEKTAIIQIPPLSYAIFALAALLLVMGIYLYFGDVPSFSIANIRMGAIKTPIFLGLSFLVLAGMNQILKTNRSMYTIMKN